MANRMRTNANARDESDQWRRRDSATRRRGDEPRGRASKALSERRSLTGRAGRAAARGGPRRGSNTQNILHSIISVFIAPQRTRKGEGAGESDGERASEHSNASVHDLAILALDVEAEWKWKPNAVHLNLKHTDKVQNTYTHTHTCTGKHTSCMYIFGFL